MGMEQIIVAFESPKSCDRVREIVENSGTASCIVCRSAAEVKRTVNKQRVSTVVCGFKLPDESAEDLFADLPSSCAMLMQMGHRLEKFTRPQRSGEEQAIIKEAKGLLMERHGMSEEQAHRFLQKKSMNSGAKMVQTAKLVLGGQ